MKIFFPFLPLVYLYTVVRSKKFNTFKTLERVWQVESLKIVMSYFRFGISYSKSATLSTYGPLCLESRILL